MSSESVPYLYSILRLVPRIERGEAMNIGLVLFCRPQRFLRVGFAISRNRVHFFAPHVEAKLIESRLETLAHIADGDTRGGPMAELDSGERFHWITNESNTMIQPAAVHPGLTTDAEATFARLFAELVAPVEAEVVE